jgi:hypothetical protein
LVEAAAFVTADTLPADFAVEEDHYETYAEARAAMNGRYAAIEDEFYTLATCKRIDAKRLDLTCTIHFAADQRIQLDRGERLEVLRLLRA